MCIFKEKMVFGLRCNLVHRDNRVELLELKSRSLGAQHCDLNHSKPDSFTLLMFNLGCNTLCNTAGKAKHEAIAAEPCLVMLWEVLSSSS